MDKSVSIVVTDKRHYRQIAQDNWGLTDKQMEGKHVHHRIHRSKGGTNDPSNLYVCSPWYHDVVWHSGDGGFIGLAAQAGKKGGAITHAYKNGEGKSVVATKAHQEKDPNGKSLHGVRSARRLHSQKDKNGKSIQGIKNAERLNAEKDEYGRSVTGIRNAERLHFEKDAKGRSIHGVKSAEKMLTQLWESTVDGYRNNAGNVAQHNKANGWDPDARVRLT